MSTFYDYTLELPDGTQKSTEDYRGKVTIVVNTATGCGFTPHYEPLEQLYEKCHEAGLEIIDIPCNQFAGQTPGTDEEIHEFCTLKYNTQFPQFKKVDINGENAIPLYGFLKEKAPFQGFDKGVAGLAMGAMLKKIDKDYKNNPEIKWNFTKFLIDREGNVVRRYEPTYDMKKFVAEVEELVNA